MTLFYKFFIPIMWIVFFGLTTLAIWVSGRELFGEMAGPQVRWVSLLLYVGSVVLLLLTLLRLKRVEVDQDNLVVTNYFKTARYPWKDVQSITERNFLFLQIVTIRLFAPGIFGRKFTFLASKKLYGTTKEELKVAGQTPFSNINR